MKNREKYPNTDDAVKAYEEHNKHCGCGVTFEEWLDLDPVEVPLGLGFAALGLALLSRITKDIERKPEPTGDEKKPDEAGNIECPLCHGKHGRSRAGGLFVDFHCPDCDALILKKSDVDKPSRSNTFAKFKEWFANLGKAAK